MRKKSAYNGFMKAAKFALFSVVALLAVTKGPAQLPAQDRETLLQHRIDTIRAAQMLGLSMRIYSASHHDQYATNFTQLTNELAGATSLNGIKIDTFEFMNAGVVDETMVDTLIFREVKPRKNPDGKLERVYCLSDGTAYNIISDDGNFDAYERQHAPTPANSTK